MATYQLTLDGGIDVDLGELLHEVQTGRVSVARAKELIEEQRDAEFAELRRLGGELAEAARDALRDPHGFNGDAELTAALAAWRSAAPKPCAKCGGTGEVYDGHDPDNGRSPCPACQPKGDRLADAAISTAGKWQKGGGE